MIQQLKKTLFLLGLFLTTATASFGVSIFPIQGESLEEGRQIEWAIDQNQDVKYFILERSNDGIHYEKISVVLVNSNETEFEFLDDNSKQGNWYRVITFGQDGIGQTSEPIFVR